jgi:signal transduction histidine kinase
MAIFLRRLALLIAALALHAGAGAALPLAPFTSIEAARSNGDTATPPVSGWRPVTLPDDWSKRWPGYDGVVWYRLTWDQHDAATPAALMIDYWTLAGAAYLNGSPIARDTHLVEPLSRSWNIPRRWLLAPPVLREGKNVLLIRLSGYAIYEPGLGSVTLGTPATIQGRYDRAQWLRRVLPTFNLGITVALATLFFAIWLMRRREAAYGWYSLALLAWAGYSLNLVATTPWPFATTDGWSRTTLIALLLFAVSYCMFAIRFLERRFPRVETLLGVGFLTGLSLMAAVPHDQIGLTRLILSSAASALYCGTVILFFASTWRSRRIDHWVLNLTNALTLAAAIHDQLVFSGVWQRNIYLAPVTSQILIVCMAIVLGWKFVSAMAQVERFNDELSEKIEAARVEMATLLNRQHELRVASSRMAERIRLAHNLHDGMGATLVNNISALEHGGGETSPARFLSTLKELREELRLVIDTSTGTHPDDRTPAEWLAPLRARLTLLCENRNILCRWQLDELGDETIAAARGLDMVRVVQEGVTNALRHSGAREIHILLQAHAEKLRLTIRDDGHGFDPEKATGPGIGLQSMASRAARLGGTFNLRSSEEGTVLVFDIARRASADNPDRSLTFST